jgi:hypothetical protein
MLEMSNNYHYITRSPDSYQLLFISLKRNTSPTKAFKNSAPVIDTYALILQQSTKLQNEVNLKIV